MSILACGMKEIIRKEECTPERLPAAAIADEVNRSLRENPFLVITAPPGAGKSTLLPITILNGLEAEGKVLMLEPRRIAARQIAERMAYLLGEQVGETVGYRIRFESKVSEMTRIEVLTEGILTKMISADPTLDGVAAVIFDEFHERSLASDLALAMVRESFQAVRPDLRIVIMSATIDAGSICRSLSAPLVESKGRLFPVEVRHTAEDSVPESCAADIARTVLGLHRDNEGDILAFLPGEGEIRRCAELLEGSLGATAVCPLYGMLSSAEQRRAVSPSRKGERKVVLATPIAETSITIEGVRIVVDSGFCRKAVFDSRTGLSHLETVRISNDMAVQRSGRAGRTAPGICLRLWSERTQRSLKDSRIPEILESDLCATALDVAVWGERRIKDMQWLTPPPSDHVMQAERTLQRLGGLTPEGMLTDLGRRLSAFPCHPRIASMLDWASSERDKALAADIAAILEENDPLSIERDGTDICLRIEFLRKGGARGRIARVARQYREVMKVREDRGPADPYCAGRLIARAYPERIAQSKGCGHFLLAGGENAKMEISDDLAVADYLAVASFNAKESGEGRIFLACPVNPEDTGLIHERDVLQWDSRAGRVLARRERRIGRLLIEERPLHNVRREDIVRAVCEAAPKEGLSMFDFGDEVQNLQRRIAAARAWEPDLGLPECTTDSILNNASEWLPLHARTASTAAELKKIDMTAVIWNMLSWEQQKEVERLAPSHIEVPTGSRIRVEYRAGTDAPVLRVRLQECFGMKETPKVNGGKVPVVMELLSPGFKPVQLTSDLGNFWKETYFEVRKELRMRYPKHSWPEDPLEALPVRGVVRKKR